MNKLRLEQIITEYGNSIYSFCYYLTSDRQEAEDLYQDTFLKAIELDRMDFNINPKSYLLGIRVNLWRNRLRKNYNRQKNIDYLTRQRESNLYYTEDDISPEDTVQKAEIKCIVHSAVNRLDKKYKLVVLLYYMEEMSVAQIAQILKIPQGTVKNRLYKARKLLEKQLEDLL